METGMIRDIIKWVFTFTMIGVTVGWGVFCVNTIFAAMQEPIAASDVLATAGVSALMGALITWDALIVQFWFRKKPSD
ncbi:hypothetical protein ES703_71939 [subsurface metagenome]|uniref:Uncharacterized protein n=1 Tax=marine sediment metagenome TaxID=412755 RepID=X1SK30_9ZZZZ